ncbi:DUF1553 domain-containing protein [Blastopirellula sp. JC732]|uniref:DUF1553 domain-containing protein n=1 Tax=Blastopirellula sediminis TaxID=2894196 RepID=A0A9X1MQE3_9BACT|nr:DUF1553 domain-containing protein [Blastopirellula sediminis]MCC9606159.1 DUF1553 domain-containing protein [Blastopirellula sediminis]MCC9630542.1 DUF1553 domain-containing protein [Blastopirellula sediminis]
MNNSHRFQSLLLLAALMLLATAGAAQAEPILEWRFDGQSQPGAWLGKFGSPAAGPQSPRYPNFSADNRATSFAGHEGCIVVKDHERGGFTNVRFGAGDTLAFEAWLKVKSIGKGHNVYLIGKGRHGKLGENLGENNQNYAVRLQGTDGGAQLGFLFTSQDPETKKTDWHRWWSKAEVPLTGWHHVAVVYTFGKGASLQAYIDGEPTDGTWDLGGVTDLPPVQDTDDLVIGAGYHRDASQSFQGWMDNIALYRQPLAPEAISQRYVYVPPPPPVTREMIPSGQVLVQISEKGVPETNGWPEEPEVTETYFEDAFGLFELPQKYVSTGVRGDRANPSHVRASAVVNLPPGKHRLLLRGRGISRLSIDGKQLLETAPRPHDPGGHGLLSAQDEYLDLGPDFRFAPPGNRDAWCEFETAGGEHFVILETMLGGITGGSKFRPELGETVVAISPEGIASWSLLSPGDRHVDYTDAGWAAYEAERREHLDKINAQARAERRAANEAYWNKRRAAAAKWLTEIDRVEVPQLPAGYPANNDIDNFIAARIDSVAKAADQGKQGGVDYFKEIRPLLEARCYSCHQGSKSQGGLRIDNLASMLEGGDSVEPAIVPGHSDEGALIARITSEDENEVMPPKGDRLSAAEVDLLKRWIKGGAIWPQFEASNFKLTPLADDMDFLRRVTLDTVGVTPTEAEIASFLQDDPAKRRANVVDRLLADQRSADHWMGYWLDVLAENPNMINPTLNNTGPFRWWLYESLLDNKPADLFVTELIRMEGSERFGGPAGFATASQNDLPMAAKGIIVSSAFLGVEMKCARCHDAPSHVSKQEDLLQVAALLKQEPVKLPESSSVPADRLHQTGRKALIEVTLAPGAVVQPVWPFERYCDEAVADALAEDPKNSRDRLAALITAPQNERFAQVMVNRIWERLMGRGLVANVADWEKGEPSHPELLRWLGQQLVASDYDPKAISRLILNSHAYQRATDPTLTATSPLYIAPAPRRLTAEQIVDSLFHATGTPFDLEEVSLDIDGVRAMSNSITLGKPRRSWMLTSTSNERDRPSLSLPKITAVTSVLTAFDWRGARQDPRSLRETEPNVLQPAIYANGVMSSWLTRLSDRHELTELALEDQPLDQLVDRVFLRLLTRKPTDEEKKRYVTLLSKGYETRVIPESQRIAPEPKKHEPERYVSWSNHVDGPANSLAMQKEAAARRGDPPSNALNEDWRLRMEDFLWAVLNTPEFIYTP